MKQKIAIIGSGNVGRALKRGLEKTGYEVRNSQRETVGETAEWGEVVMLAVPFTALDDVVRELGNTVNGKQRWMSRTR
jgi:8-hydroxy-5-deazaflavin:NADPH oxidoreductase